jgi:hypothetical protein
MARIAEVLVRVRASPDWIELTRSQYRPFRNYLEFAAIAHKHCARK